MVNWLSLADHVCIFILVWWLNAAERVSRNGMNTEVYAIIIDFKLGSMRILLHCEKFSWCHPTGIETYKEFYFAHLNDHYNHTTMIE